MRYLLALATFALLTGSGFAQERRPQLKRIDNPENYLKATRATARATTASTNSELFTAVTIPAGGSMILDSTIDYTDSNDVQITVRSAGTDAANLAIASTWSIPGAPSFHVGTVIFGSDFFFNNTGGGGFSVAGKQLRVVFYNLGTTTITLASVIIFTPGY